jgi:hypothetical protein
MANADNRGDANQQSGGRPVPRRIAFEDGLTALDDDIAEFTADPHGAFRH